MLHFLSLSLALSYLGQHRAPASGELTSCGCPGPIQIGGAEPLSAGEQRTWTTCALYATLAGLWRGSLFQVVSAGGLLQPSYLARRRHGRAE